MVFEGIFAMYFFTTSVVETIKMFCMSILCSVPFSLMIYRGTVVFYEFVCFVLNLTAFVLFVFFYYRNWSKRFQQAFSTSEYIIPAIASYSVYFIVSSVLYVNKVGSVYKWLFQHTRFLEPVLNPEYSFISFLIAQVLILAVLVIVPYYRTPRK